MAFDIGIRFYNSISNVWNSISNAQNLTKIDIEGWISVETFDFNPVLYRRIFDIEACNIDIDTGRYRRNVDIEVQNFDTTDSIRHSSLRFDIQVCASPFFKKEFEWAGGPELKLFAQNNYWRAIWAKHADKGLSPVSGKAGHDLLSFVLGYFIHITC